MDAVKVSAQFAAFVWFSNGPAKSKSCTRAVQFAQDNWSMFLPLAHEGLGRLLLKIAEPRVAAARRNGHEGSVPAKRMRPSQKESIGPATPGSYGRRW